MKQAVLIGGLFLSLATTAPVLARRPNFVIVSCDNLGYGDIEPFGSELNRTPSLNRMAEQGRRFTHFCVTAGVCTPSRASLMTGCYAQRVGMHTNPRDGFVLRPVSPHGLHPDEITIAEVLKEQGYATAIIGKWHLGDQPQFLPTRQGFDEFFGVPYSDDMTLVTGRRLGDRFQGNSWPPLPLMDGDAVVESPPDRNELTRRYTERAIRFISRHQDEPFFLYLPHAMPGSTREPFSGPAFRGKSKNGAWGDSVEELDWSTGRILDHLVELGIDRDTLVVFTSDNGAPGNRGVNLPLFGPGYTTAEGAFRVPTILWWPGQIPAGTTCDQLCTTMDFLPTFARLAGTREPIDRVIDGHDIRDLVLGKPGAESPYESFFYYQADQLQAVRSGPWKLFLPLDAFTRHPHFKKGQSDRPRLINVVTDIDSSHDVAESHPMIVQRLTRLAQAARDELGDVGKVGSGIRPRGKVDNPMPQQMSSR